MVTSSSSGVVVLGVVLMGALLLALLEEDEGEEELESDWGKDSKSGYLFCISATFRYLRLCMSSQDSQTHI